METLFQGKAFRLEKDGKVLVLTFDLQGERVNKLFALPFEELEIIIDNHINPNASQFGCVLLRSAKTQSFIVGADINVIKSLKEPSEAFAASKRGQDVFNKVEDSKVPFLAAIEGPCMGGGTELSLACRFRIASLSSKTAIAVPEVKLGFLPGWGGSYRLPKIVGLAGSLDMMLTGKNIRADKADKMGLVHDSIPEGVFAEKSLAIAHQIANGKNPYANKQRKVDVQTQVLENTWVGRKVVFSKALESVMKETRGNYPAPLQIIDHLQNVWGADRKKWLEKEAEVFRDLWATDASKNLVNLFFLVESNKKDSGTSLSEEQIKALQPFRSLAVLGAGVMGGGIGFVSANAGLRVCMKDIQMDAVAKGLAHAAKLFDGDLKRRKITVYERQGKMDLLRGQIDYSGFKSQDLIIEAVVEDLNIKRKVFAELEEKVSPICVIATNTSSLRLKDMASSLKDSSRFVGLHFFNPVHKMPLVEVISHDGSSEESIARSVAYCRKIGKTPIVVKDGPGFLVNRLLLPWLNEAAYCLEQGYRIEFLDTHLKNFGMPMGPCELLDEIGLDVGAKVAHILHDSLGEHFKPSETLEKIAKAAKEQNRMGRKSGLGFYKWDAPGGKRLENEQVAIDQLFFNGRPPSAPSLSPEALVHRMIFPMINEAAVILQEGLVSSPEVVDIGMIFGTGFPPFRGGLLRYADSIGLSRIVDELERMADSCGPRMKPSSALRSFAKKGSGFYK